MFQNGKGGTWCSAGVREVPCLPLRVWNEGFCGDRPLAFSGDIWFTIETMCTDRTIGSQVTAFYDFSVRHRPGQGNIADPLLLLLRREVKPNNNQQSAE